MMKNKKYKNESKSTNEGVQFCFLIILAGKIIEQKRTKIVFQKG